MAGIVFILSGLLLLGGLAESALLGTSLLIYAFVAVLVLGIVWIYVYSWLVYIGKMK